MQTFPCPFPKIMLTNLDLYTILLIRKGSLENKIKQLAKRLFGNIHQTC